MRVLSLWLLVVLALVSLAAAEEPVAVLKTIQGQVDLVRGEVATQPAVGDPIKTGDILKTGRDGTAGLTFQDGTRVSLGPSSEMNMRNYRFDPPKKDFTFDVFMNKGSAMYSSGKLGRMAPEAVRFTTPNATVGIRGTRFLVKVD